MQVRSRIAFLAGIVAVTAAAPAWGQATRTWVSGTGDDVNPCSRTAPCKTFAGAISKTAAGGEINCLDAGGFGAVTIIKSMTIDCRYTEGGVLAGGNGITVNAQPTDVVYLRGLDIFGVNPPTHGVRFVAGAAVHIEDCIIRRFNSPNSFGISFQTGSTSNLYVTNTTVANNGNGATGGGILVQPTGTGVARVTLQNVRVQNNANFGMSVNSTGNSGQGIAVVVDYSQFSGNGSGIAILSPAGTAGIVGMVTNSSILHHSGSGISADGAGITFRVGNTTINGNAFVSGAGVNLLNNGKVHTYLDNRLDGNGTNGAFTAPSIPLK
jgi:hypothetical protein